MIIFIIKNCNMKVSYCCMQNVGIGTHNKKLNNSSSHNMQNHAALEKKKIVNWRGNAELKTNV